MRGRLCWRPTGRTTRLCRMSRCRWKSHTSGTWRPRRWWEAQQLSFREAETNRFAASERQRVGMGTVADVLQAKTVVSSAQLALQTTEGQLHITRGGLALSMGLPANTPYDIERMPEQIPSEGISQTVDQLIEQALKSRSDLASARAQFQAAQAHARDVGGRAWPALLASGSAGNTWIPEGENAGSYSAALLLNVPLFTGYSMAYDTKQARYQAEAQGERTHGLEQQVTYDVFQFVLRSSDGGAAGQNDRRPGRKRGTERNK